MWPGGPAPLRRPIRGRGRGAAGSCCPMRGRGAFGGSVGGGSRRHEPGPRAQVVLGHAVPRAAPPLLGRAAP